jgi:hypothetical protein
MKALMENRTARMTILIDPIKKQIFEDICAQQDLTSSQVIRRLMRQYILDNAGSRELPEWLIGQAAKGGNASQ